MQHRREYILAIQTVQGQTCYTVIMRVIFLVSYCCIIMHVKSLRYEGCSSYISYAN